MTQSKAGKYLYVRGEFIYPKDFIGTISLDTTEYLICNHCDNDISQDIPEKDDTVYLYRNVDSGVIWIICGNCDKKLQKVVETEIVLGKFLMVVWQDPSGSDAMVLANPGGDNKLFATKEEAEEYYNKELNGYYKVIEIEE